LGDNYKKNVEVEKCKSKEENNKIAFKYLFSEWYKHVVHYLLFLECPPSFDRAKYKALRFQAKKFVISNVQLYWMGLVGVLLLFLTEEEIPKIINEFNGCTYR